MILKMLKLSFVIDFLRRGRRGGPRKSDMDLANPNIHGMLLHANHVRYERQPCRM